MLWAVYEIETTCSMLYGFPLSINDDDCDVEFLNPYSLRSDDASWDATVREQTDRATPLSQKHAMAQLCVIVKSALTDLYGLRQRRMHTNGSLGAANRNSLQGLMASVKNLDTVIFIVYLAREDNLLGTEAIRTLRKILTGKGWSS